MPLNILIAEDSATNRLLFSITMTRLGHQVDIASNGQEAVELFRDNIYHLVFLDLYMPVMGGIEAAFAIKRLNARNVPVYAISGLPPDDKAQKFQEVGIRRCLLKPLDREKLAEVAHENGLDANFMARPDGRATQAAPRRLMISYAHELRSRSDACGVFFRDRDHAALYREARTIESLADMLGIDSLKVAAKALEDAADTRYVLELHIRNISVLCQSAADEIEAHAPPPQRI